MFFNKITQAVDLRTRGFSLKRPGNRQFTAILQDNVNPAITLFRSYPTGKQPSRLDRLRSRLPDFLDCRPTGIAAILMNKGHGIAAHVPAVHGTIDIEGAKRHPAIRWQEPHAYRFDAMWTNGIGGLHRAAGKQKQHCQGNARQ